MHQELTVKLEPVPKAHVLPLCRSLCRSLCREHWETRQSGRQRSRIRLFGTGSKLSITFVILSALAAPAENAVVLESFENGINCAALVTNYGGRPVLRPPGVALSSYAKKE